MKQELIPNRRNGVNFATLKRYANMPQKFVTKNGETYDESWNKFYKAREKFNKGLHGCFWYLGSFTKQEHLPDKKSDGSTKCKACYKTLIKPTILTDREGKN